MESLIQGRDIDSHFDWRRVSRLVLVSRTIDSLEETRLLPEKKVSYQFSSRGHDLVQILLGSMLTGPHDAVGAYYRSRPLLLSLGLEVEDALAGPLAKSGGYSDGRDIGVVCNLARTEGPTVLPMAGDVGSQFTPAAGWAQAILYHARVLQEESYRNCIAVALGGEGSVATNGFWSALTMATTLRLPLLFFIEDNGFGISVPAALQTPGGDIAANLAAFRHLHVLSGDGSDPVDSGEKIKDAVDFVRGGQGAALLRLQVPRLAGHSGQDNQAYKSRTLIEEERARDPLGRLRHYLVPAEISEQGWEELELRAKEEVEKALQRALKRPEPDVSTVRRYVFSERREDGSPELQRMGGLAPQGHHFPDGSDTPEPEPSRINMLTAIRRTLQAELQTNGKLLVFGEDVGPKGGVHAATLGLAEEFGKDRVFDTSLSEEGIVGRAVGMALAGLLPVAEIQFRKYADPATEQLNNCGTIRWRTANHFAAPLVIRMPGGFSKCGDPWHSVCGEVEWVHAIGWRVAFPSNAEDATGLLREAMRGNDPTLFFEHRALLDAAWARRPYPGDRYLLPFGRAKVTQGGEELTVVTWGAMVERCELARRELGASIEIIDLRTLVPWDRSTVVESVARTKRCLIVHEDALTAGFGAEISAVLVKEAFFHLDAPIERLAVPDVPIPYNIGLMAGVVPGVSTIAQKMTEILEF
ncbi:MAG: transketolase C-terminal domain-containing protein [Acidobacteriota bacterium]